MGRDTGIQWCDSTVSPTTGCDGCELWTMLEAYGRPAGPCWAGNLHETRLAKAMPTLYAPSFTEIRLAPGRMKEAAGWSDLAGTSRPGKPWLDGLPRVIFVEDMGDLFSKAVPFGYIHEEVIGAATSKKGSRHIYMLLTKQGKRLAEFAEWLTARGVAWPENVWPGVSIIRRSSLRRIEGLLRVPAKVRYVSVEPLWESVDLKPYLGHHALVDMPSNFGVSGPGLASWKPPIDLVIIGGESKQDDRFECHPFNVRWARDLIRDCRQSGVKPFLKQLGSAPYIVRYNENSTTDPGDEVPIRLKDHHGGDWSEWPEDLRVREFPSVSESLAGALR